MTLAEYRTLTTRTLPDLGRVLVDTVREELPATGNAGGVFKLGMLLGENANKLNYAHMALGLATEIGELVECVGTDLKFEFDPVHLGEEIGDLYWYLANYANLRGINLPESLHVDIPNEECMDFLIIKVQKDLLDIVKRFLAYNTPIDRVKETLIVCDVRLALQVIENTYKLDGGEIRRKNIAKLVKRFPEKFDDYLATHRDLVAERKELE